MCDKNRRQFIASSLALSAAAALVGAHANAAGAADEAKVWVCPPCGCPDDSKEFSARGRCPSCDMELIEKTKRKA